jgi:molybdate transport system ATP-binding protein
VPPRAACSSIASSCVRERIGLVSPELQQRYLQQDWRLTGLQVVQSGFLNTDYLHQHPDARQRARVAALARRLGVEDLLRRNAQELSTGELRKLLIARALAGEPRVLICDELCDGLDSRSRTQLLAMLEQAARGGTQLLYTTHRCEELIPAITHTLVLERGRVVKQGRVLKRDGATVRGGTRARKPVPAIPRESSAHLIHIRDANVFLNRKKVLRSVNWEMRAAQNWVVFGPNGAGKTTLLKLIFGDVQPAMGGLVRRFDLTAKNSVWDLKRRIGCVSPDLQANYSADVTGADVIASGFFSSVGLMDKVTRTQRDRVRKLMLAFGAVGLGDKRALRMSYGEFRRVLLLRALVNEPKILICDEPFDGLDADAKAQFALTLERVSRNGTRLIVVTHHLDDLPRCLTHGLLLEGGRVVCQGSLEAVRTHPRVRWLHGGA